MANSGEMIRLMETGNPYEVMRMAEIDSYYRSLRDHEPARAARYWDRAFEEFCHANGLTPQQGEAIAWEVTAMHQEDEDAR
jgi:hypothetical protein